MTVRNFPDAAGITLAPGNAAALPTGAWTIAVIAKPAVLSSYQILVAVGHGISDLALWITSSGGIQAVLNGFGRPIDLPLVENEWFLIAITKTAGVAIPRGHAYRYSTGTWTHLSATDALEDKVSVSVIELGRTNNDWFYNGYMAVAGVWNTALSDTQIETLETDLQAWLDSGAVALWLLNQDSVAIPVQDITGGGADQTAQSGTEIVFGDDPPGFNFELGGGGEPINVSVGVAIETSGAFAVAKRKRKTITYSIENSSTFGVGSRALKSLGLANEISEAFSVAARKRRLIEPAIETNLVFPIIFSARKFFSVAPAIEIDTALLVSRSKVYQVDTTHETSLAFPIVSSNARLVLVSTAIETSIAFVFIHNKIHRVGLARETNLALPILLPRESPVIPSPVEVNIVGLMRSVDISPLVEVLIWGDGTFINL